MENKIAPMDRRGFMRLSALAGGSAFLLATGTSCGQTGSSGNGKKTGYTGDVAVTGLASLIHSAPFFIAQAEGYYEEEGLSLEHIEFPGGLDTVRGVESGIGFGTSSTIPVFIAAEKGLDVKTFGNVYTAASVDFIARADSAISSIEDVRGKKIGVSRPGSNSTYFAERTLKEAGIDLKEVEMVDVGGASDSWTLVKQGVVDVGWTASPLAEKIQTESRGKIIWRSRDYVADWSDTCLIATGKFLEENTEALKGWGRAVGKGMKLIETDLEKAAEIYGKAIKYKPEVAFEALKNSQNFFSLDFTSKQLDAVVDAATEQGLITKKPDMDSIVMKDFLV